MDRIYCTHILLFLLSANLMAGKGESESDIGFLTSMPPQAPVLEYPLNEDEIHLDSATLTWKSVDHASAYIVQISDTEQFSSFVAKDTSIENSYPISSLTDSLTFYWRISGYNKAGTGSASEVWSFTTNFSSVPGAIISGDIEHTFQLSVFPNPFHQTVRIKFQLDEPADISICIYNSAGQYIRELASGYKNKGSYIIEWNGCNSRGAPVPGGSYYGVLSTGKQNSAMKIVTYRK